MKRIKSNKGFTLVELLAVIVIVGILLGVSITAIIHFIDKAKAEQLASQEKTLTMAAQNYLQDDRSQLPKSVGETTTVYANVLRYAKYLTEDIKNSKNESCMPNSYVVARKESTTKYTYKAYLYCGNDGASATTNVAVPVIKIDFVDSEGNSITNNDDVASSVMNARFTIEYQGGKKNGGAETPIDGYSYSILVKIENEANWREVFTSGTISANKATNIFIDSSQSINLTDYIDVSTSTAVAIKAVVRNVDGGVNNKIQSVGDEDSTQAEIVYKDAKKPTCGIVTGEPGENEWINLSTPSGTRKITVTCKDNKGGSGCVRSKFTKTFTSDDSMQYGFIEIKDNADNRKECQVRVNIDRARPVINVKSYARGEDPGTVIGGNTLTGTSTNQNAYGGNATIHASEYNNLVNGYMDAEHYPNGVTYRITLSDNVGLKSLRWQVNEKNMIDGYGNMYTDQYEAIKNDTSCKNEKTCTIDVYFSYSGKRKGILTVTDLAGNTSKFTIHADIDRSAPDKPTIVNSSSNDANGAWTKGDVTLTISSKAGLSSIGHYYYSYNKNPNGYGNSDSDARTKWVDLPEGYGLEEFTKTFSGDRNDTVYIKACSVSGNCSAASHTKLMIDRTDPTGLTVIAYKKSSSENVTSYNQLSAAEQNDTYDADGSDWSKNCIVLFASGASDSGSGEITYKVTVTGASTNVVDAEQNYRNVNAEGTSYVQFSACDKAGNCISNTSTIRLDNHGPVTPTIYNPTGGNWTNSDIILDISSSDNGVGIGKYYYRYNNNYNSSNANDLTGWSIIGGANNKDSFSINWTNGEAINKTLYVKACDKLSNCSEVFQTDLKVDNVAPSTPTITNPNETNGVVNWATSSFNLTLTSSDNNGGSGLADYQYTYKANGDTDEVGSDDTTQWKSDGKTATESYATTYYTRDRNQRVYWRVCDNAGNCSSSNSTLIKLDRYKPIGCSSYTITDSSNGISGKFACSDVASLYNVNSGCKVDEVEFNNKTSTFSVVLEDNAGNKTTCTATIGNQQCYNYTPGSSWEVDGIYNSASICSGDTNTYDFETYSCSSSNLLDVCSSGCQGKESKTCCVKRSWAKGWCRSITKVTSS